MVLGYINDISDNYKIKFIWWYLKLNNKNLKIFDDPWFGFIIYWMMFDAYITEISKCNRDDEKLEYFYNQKNDFKDNIVKNWNSLLGHIKKLKELSPVDDMRPNPKNQQHLKNENNVKEVFDFIYRIRCNLFHGGKNVKNNHDRGLVLYAGKFLSQCFEINQIK